MSEKRLFNDGWSFREAEIQPQWNPVEIPHDWLIYDTANLYKNSEGWYRKEFDVLNEDIDSKRFFLRFDGIYMDSEVFVNGKTAFVWKYGYSAFEFEISGFLTAGFNEILVRVIYQSPNSRWYSGAGIYRDIWLKTTIKNKPRICSDGIYITPYKQSGDNWVVEIDTEIENNNEKISLRHTIIDKNKNIAGISRSQMITVTSPELWDITEPNLYILKTELLESDEIIETEENRFGFRTVEFNPDKGFILNGRNVKLNGVCQHHDLGCLGSAVNRAALKRQLKIGRAHV